MKYSMFSASIDGLSKGCKDANTTDKVVCAKLFDRNAKQIDKIVCGT